MRKEWIQLTEEVGVSVVQQGENKYDVAVMTCWFPLMSRGKWEIEEDYVYASEGLSSMEVYGYIEHQVKPAYLTPSF